MKFFRNKTEKRRTQSTRTRPRVEALEDRVVMYGGNGLEFNITPVAGVPQQVVDAFKVATDQWSAILTDDIIVNVTIDFTANAAGLGQASPANTIKSLAEIRNALTADQRSLSDISAVAHLPAGTSAALYTTDFNTGVAFLDDNGTDNNMSFNFPRATAKAMGLRPANDPASDGLIRFRNLSSFDFDRSDGIAAGKYDFIGVAMHELGHLLGFLSGAETVDFRSKPNGPGYNAAINQDNQIVLKPQDLFRFSVASVAAGADLDLRADLAPKYFSIDGGVTQLGNFSTGTNNGDGHETHHWKDNLGLGVMDPTIWPGEYSDVTALDVQVLDVIGWDLRMDYGDAPDTGAGTGAGNLRTTLADNGPRHILFAPSGLLSDPIGSPKVFLGTGVEADPNGQPTPLANGDSDDGVAALPTLVTGTTVHLVVTSTASAAKPAVLNYFVDFNQNGDFSDSGEAFAVTLTSASQSVPIVVPAGAMLGNTFARLRISTAGGLGPNGPANDGEVEDYRMVVAAPISPTVGNVALLEDTLSGPIAIQSPPNQGVTHFKISGITGGTLFKSDGVTPIVNGSFVTVAEGQAGVRFRPTLNSNATGRFDVESSQNGTTVAAQSGKATSTISIIPVGDTPKVANATTAQGTLSAAIVISRNPADGAEVTHFRVSGITGGTLFKNNGTTPITNGAFITFAEAQAGVKFLPAANSLVAGRFDVESSQNGSTVAAQSGKATSTITVTSAAKVYISGIVGGSQLAVAATINSGVFSGGGKLTAPNGQVYVITVQSGNLVGTKVRLQGTLKPLGGTTSVAFTLYADAATGFIQFSYLGANGNLITQTTLGTVILQ